MILEKYNNKVLLYPDSMKLLRALVPSNKEVFFMAEQAEELLTVQEVAGILRVDQTTVRRWIKEGTLASIRLPHRGKREVHRVRRSALDLILK